MVEPIVVTPLCKAPWIKVSDKDTDAFFAVVSGHRRRQAALDTKRLTVPIRVRVYKDAEAHETDMILLNGPRANLTPIEEGYEAVRLLRQEGVTVEKVAKLRGKSMSWVKGRIALTKLSPDIQDLLSPRLKARKRLQTQIGSILGELSAPTEEVLSELLFWAQDKKTKPGELSEDERRFCLQRLLLDQIHAQRMRATKAKDFIYEVIADSNPSSGFGSRSTRDEPRKRREIVLNLLHTIGKSSVFGWSDDICRRAFKPASLAQLIMFTKEAEARRTDLEGLVSTLTIMRDERQASVQSEASTADVTEVSETERLHSGSPDEVACTEPSPHVKHPSLQIRPETSPSQLTPRNGADPRPISFPIKGVEFWDYGPPGKMLLGTVRSPFHFAELWEKKLFGWQIRKEPKPEDFPELADVQRIINRR